MSLATKQRVGGKGRRDPRQAYYPPNNKKQEASRKIYTSIRTGTITPRALPYAACPAGPESRATARAAPRRPPSASPRFGATPPSRARGSKVRMICRGRAAGRRRTLASGPRRSRGTPRAVGRGAPRARVGAARASTCPCRQRPSARRHRVRRRRMGTRAPRAVRGSGDLDRLVRARQSSGVAGSRAFRVAL